MSNRTIMVALAVTFAAMGCSEGPALTGPGDSPAFNKGKGGGGSQPAANPSAEFIYFDVVSSAGSEGIRGDRRLGNGTPRQSGNKSVYADGLNGGARSLTLYFAGNRIAGPDFEDHTGGHFTNIREVLGIAETGGDADRPFPPWAPLARARGGPDERSEGWRRGWRRWWTSRMPSCRPEGWARASTSFPWTSTSSPIGPFRLPANSGVRGSKGVVPDPANPPHGAAR